MAAHVVLNLTGSMDHLRLVWQVGETLLEPVAFADDPEGTRYNILLALQEMLTNVLRHAYAPSDPRPIEVTFDVTDSVVEIGVRDRGREFNPLEYEATELMAADAPALSSGGYGIYITRMVMDEVTYQRTGGWNHLRMRKLCNQSAEVEQF